MKTSECIRKRRSTRSFDNIKVSKKSVLDILYYANMAPSAKNRQPWRFLIVNDKDKKFIVNTMLDWNKNNKNFVYKDEHNKIINNSIKKSAEIINQSPVLILVFKEQNEMWERSDTLSIGAAIENALLRATDLGFGSLWIADVMQVYDQIMDHFNFKSMELVSAISIGKIKTPNKIPNKLKLKDVLL